MRKLTLLVAAACLLSAPLASAAQCGLTRANVTAERGGGGAGASAHAYVSTGAQLVAEVAGVYGLSNGRRLELVELNQDLYADFGRLSRVRLQEVGPHRFASREGDIQMTWTPGRITDTILLSYPADSRGRLKRSCS